MTPRLDGCPVVVSTAGSLPEIAGGAALLVEPCDAGALADAVRRALTDEATRKELIDRGLRRAAEFSWERAASETMAVYAAVRERLASRAIRSQSVAGLDNAPFSF